MIFSYEKMMKSGRVKNEKSVSATTDTDKISKCLNIRNSISPDPRVALSQSCLSEAFV